MIPIFGMKELSFHINCYSIMVNVFLGVKKSPNEAKHLPPMGPYNMSFNDWFG